MQTTELISVREYLSTSYRPDCDYVDGVVLERNVGELEHSMSQREIMVYLWNRRDDWGIHVFPALRMQVKPTRFRVPDVCVVLGEKPAEVILTAPPFICIEILSRDDRMSQMQDRIDDYLNFGVPNVWILDPRTPKAYTCTKAGLLEVTELRTKNPEIVVPLNAIFE